jgi:hypothetical protein
MNSHPLSSAGSPRSSLPLPLLSWPHLPRPLPRTPLDAGFPLPFPAPGATDAPFTSFTPGASVNADIGVGASGIAETGVGAEPPYNPPNAYPTPCLASLGPAVFTALATCGAAAFAICGAAALAPYEMAWWATEWTGSYGGPPFAAAELGAVEGGVVGGVPRGRGPPGRFCCRASACCLCCCCCSN